MAVTEDSRAEHVPELYYKKFKDPLYDYIEIESSIVSNIIDTPSFQRLKDIRQTSYTPLFPAAYHNRYVHSLGVYHLGRMAFKSIKSQLEEYSEGMKLHDNIDNIQEIFELACLLHDVGHAPFSHTGEKFYLDKSETLYKTLKACVGTDEFSIDFDALGTKKPAPHECMSCIVGLRIYSDYFHNSEQRELFARCIIGLQKKINEKEPSYQPQMNSEEKRAVKKERNIYQLKKKEVELLNCVISILNSSIIDVDRLDYIIRDSATIGFKNVQVDYVRLLDGLRIVKYKEQANEKKQNQNKYCIGYHKKALSVLESVIYAHDAEKKWIQGHPAILYEMTILQNAMGELTRLFRSEADINPIFCYEALTEKGKELSIPLAVFSDEAKDLWNKNKLFTSEANALLQQKNLFSFVEEIEVSELEIVKKYPIFLLADEDFLYLMKTFCKDGLGYEYFARNKRRYAAWKSEAEFRALFQERIGDESKNIKTLESNFENLFDYCLAKTGAPIVKDEIYHELDKEEQNACQSKENGELDDYSYEDIKRGIDEKRYWVQKLEQIANELELEFEFLIIFQKKFNSSFSLFVGDIPILFPNLDNSVVPLKNVVDVLRSSADKKSNFFHLFYKRKDSCNENKKTIVNRIAKGLISAIEP